MGGKLLGVQQQQHWSKVDARREETIAKLWNITETLNVLYRENWTLMASREMIKFQNKMIDTVRKHMESSDTPCSDTGMEKEKKLTIMTSFIYCLSLITTVGE